jgi:hypothetical protein
MLRRSVIAALAFVISAAFIPQAQAASTFYGIVLHVSTNNIKVQNPQSKQTLSFGVIPKFKQVFSDDGKTTYQMSAIKPGRYVRIIYDQKALGIRHADRITLLNNANEVLGHQ